MTSTFVAGLMLFFFLALALWLKRDVKVGIKIPFITLFLDASGDSNHHK